MTEFGVEETAFVRGVSYGSEHKSQAVSSYLLTYQIGNRCCSASGSSMTIAFCKKVWKKLHPMIVASLPPVQSSIQKFAADNP
jgi:hypothetical protein